MQIKDTVYEVFYKDLYNADMKIEFIEHQPCSVCYLSLPRWISYETNQGTSNKKSDSFGSLLILRRERDSTYQRSNESDWLPLIAIDV